MKVSFHWLREFVDIPSDPRQVKSDLTMIGLNTEALAPAGDDWVLDVEVTTNRPDCLNHCGIARELATLYRKPLRKIEIAVKESAEPAAGEVSIEIADPDLCARYCGRVVRNVQVKPSPGWLVRRLEAVGQRPINNVADVTNYVLMELGHPLHAFDLSRLRQQRIIVRRAKPGESLRTLDGVDHTLTRDNLVIADAAHPVALAGVMGGEESEISALTQSILLESAWFDPVSIRRTAKAHGMHTEASHRFERGADIEMAPRALDRAAALIRELAGGTILHGVIDVYPRPFLPPCIRFRRSELTRILGAEIDGAEVERILRGLEFQVERQDGESWLVSAPSFRLDVHREVDLIEEVARHFGYDRLPARVRPAPPRVERDTTRDKVMEVSAALTGMGFHEIIASSMVDPAEGERFADASPVMIANPLSQDVSAMRTSAVPSMLRAIRWNLDRDANDVRLFELGKTYKIGRQGAPEERRVLALGSTGHRRPASVHDNEVPLAFFDLKGDLETVLNTFELPVLDFEPAELPYYEPGECGRLGSRSVELAVFGQIRQDLAREYRLRQAVWVAEIDFERLLDLPLRSRKFRPFSKFPAVERDFSLVVPEAIPYARLSAAVGSLDLAEVCGFRPVDRADRSKASTLPAGHYALLLRVDFQGPTHTLASEEINQLSERVLAALEPLGVRLRD
jgi:phenylalanyl-tRNA synthetase beta chain